MIMIAIIHCFPVCGFPVSVCVFPQPGDVLKLWVGINIIYNNEHVLNI